MVVAASVGCAGFWAARMSTNPTAAPARAAAVRHPFSHARRAVGDSSWATLTPGYGAERMGRQGLSVGVRIQGSSVLPIPILHLRRTPENGTSMAPSLGNAPPSGNSANLPNSATTPGSISGGGGEKSCQVPPTLYLMAAPRSVEGATISSVALSLCAWNKTKSANRLIGSFLIIFLPPFFCLRRSAGSLKAGAARGAVPSGCRAP